MSKHWPGILKSDKIALAAPDLLAALKIAETEIDLCIRTFKAQGIESKYFFNSLSIIRAAIAKAEDD